MSICTYPMDTSGLLIDKDIAVIVNICRALSDHEPGAPMIRNKAWPEVKAMLETDPSIRQDYANPEEAFDFLRDEMDLPTEPEFCGQFTGEAETMDEEWPGGRVQEKDRIEISYDDEFVGYIPFKKNPSLFGETPYKDRQELLDELSEVMKDVLPEGFDIRPYIVNIGGTYWC